MNIVYSITFIRAKAENNSSASSSIIGNHTREYNTTAKVYYSYIFYDVKGKKKSQKNNMCVYICICLCVYIWCNSIFWACNSIFIWVTSKTKQKRHQINFYRELLTQNRDGNYFQRGKTGIKSKRCLHGISNNTDNVLFIQLDTMHTHVFLH